MTAILPSTLNYTDRDFDSLKDRMEGLARTVFPTWTDFSDANFGNILLEMMAFVGDMLSFYQDRQANELFWATAKRRDSIIRLAAMIDYTLSSAASATGTETFYLPFVAPKKVIIPLGSIVQSADPDNPVQFRTLAASEIPLGSTSALVAVEEATVVAGEAFQSSDEPGQEIVLSRVPYLDDSAAVTTSSGTFTQVANFLSSGPTDKHFQTLVDEFDTAHLRFGNGVNGEIPQGILTVDYKIGGGVLGNVEAGQLSILQTALLYDDGNTAPVAVTNAAATSGGVDRESLNRARLNAPAALRALYRSVSASDFSSAAEAIAGVARAILITSNEYYSLEENTGKLYVVAQGQKLDSGYTAAAVPSSTLLSTIESTINTNTPPTVTFTWEAVPAEFIPVNISTRVYLEYGANATTVAAAIRASVADFFAAQTDEGAINSNIDFGANLRAADNTISGEIAWSDVMNAIRDITGVRRVDEGSNGLLINGLRSSLILGPMNFPLYVSIIIINADTEGAM